MKKNKRNRKQKLHPAITDCLQQRKKARSLGYENAEQYQQGLSVVKRLLANKDKDSEPENPPCRENTSPATRT